MARVLYDWDRARWVVRAHPRWRLSPAAEREARAQELALRRYAIEAELTARQREEEMARDILQAQLAAEREMRAEERAFQEAILGKSLAAAEKELAARITAVETAQREALKAAERAQTETLGAAREEWTARHEAAREGLRERLRVAEEAQRALLAQHQEALDYQLLGNPYVPEEAQRAALERIEARRRGERPLGVLGRIAPIWERIKRGLRGIGTTETFSSPELSGPYGLGLAPGRVTPDERLGAAALPKFGAGLSKQSDILRRAAWGKLLLSRGEWPAVIKGLEKELSEAAPEDIPSVMQTIQELERQTGRTTGLLPITEGGRKALIEGARLRAQRLAAAAIEPAEKLKQKAGERETEKLEWLGALKATTEALGKEVRGKAENRAFLQRITDSAAELASKGIPGQMVYQVMMRELGQKFPIPREEEIAAHERFFRRRPFGILGKPAPSPFEIRRRRIEGIKRAIQEGIGKVAVARAGLERFGEQLEEFAEIGE